MTLKPKPYQLCEKVTTYTVVKTQSAGVQDDISAMTKQLNALLPTNSLFIKT
jgi:hypothetical protein